jgi:acetoin utilization protein AcuB
MSIRLADVMSTEVATISADATAQAAWDLMRSNRIRHLVVLAPRSREIVGVVSERDLGGRLAEERRPGVPVEEVMSPQLVTAKPTTGIREAANLLRGYVVGCLPVVEEGKLVGIVTISDLLDLLGRGAERPLARAGRPTLRLHASRIAGPAAGRRR